MSTFATPNAHDLTRILAEHLAQGGKAPPPGELVAMAAGQGVKISGVEAKNMIRNATKFNQNLTANLPQGPKIDPFYKSPVGEGVQGPSLANLLGKESAVTKTAPINTASRLATAATLEKGTEATRVASALSAAGKGGLAATAEELGAGALALSAEAAPIAATGLKGVLGMAGRALPWVGAALTTAQIIQWLYSVTQGRKMQGRADAFAQGAALSQDYRGEAGLQETEAGADTVGRLIQQQRSSAIQSGDDAFKQQQDFAKLIGDAHGQLAQISQVEPMGMDEVAGLAKLLSGVN